MTAGRRVAVAALAMAIAIPAEGLRQWAYRDPVGVLTVCYGHTGPDVAPKTYRTLAECRALLSADMAVAVDAVERCQPGLPVPVAASFADAVFNLGPRIVCDPKASTAARLLRIGDYAGACNQLPRWSNAKVAGVSVQLPGLVKRRESERRLCLSGLDAVPKVHRDGEGGIAPAALESVGEGVFVHAQLASPGGYALRPSVMGGHDVGPRVPLLLLDRRPSTVSWLVAARPVEPIEGRFYGPLSHVGQEVGKGEPAVAHSDALGAVSREAMVIRASAPADHVHPSVVSRAHAGVVRMPMFHARGTRTGCGTKVRHPDATRVHLRPIGRAALWADSAGIHDESLSQNKARVAGVLVALPGLTKRAREREALCLTWRQP